MKDSHNIIYSDPNPNGEKVSISKDASCQTSDCELFSHQKSENLPNNNRPRRHYSDHRRATDSLLQGGGGRKEANRSLVRLKISKKFLRFK